MIAFDNVLAWIAIGVAASLAGMIWPFQRGTAGVVANIVLSVGGAVGLALVSYAFMANETPARLIFAAVGALAALAIGHLIWDRRVDATRRDQSAVSVPRDDGGDRPRVPGA